MAVSSMTGFARAAGSGGTWRWTFELKTVNAKGLDIRLRMPAPFDRAEGEARARLAKALVRGTCFATLSAQREGATAAARIDLAALESIAVAARAAADQSQGSRRRRWTDCSLYAACLRRPTSRMTRRP